MKKPIIRPSAEVTVAPGASGTIITVDHADTRNLDVWLVAIGTGIDPISNAAFAFMRLLVNGQRDKDFGNMTSQFGSIDNPYRPARPIWLGRNVKVELVGQMESGATGNTQMAGVLELVAVTPGELP